MSQAPVVGQENQRGNQRGIQRVWVCLEGIALSSLFYDAPTSRMDNVRDLSQRITKRTLQANPPATSSHQRSAAPTSMCLGASSPLQASASTSTRWGALASMPPPINATKTMRPPRLSCYRQNLLSMSKCVPPNTYSTARFSFRSYTRCGNRCPPTPPRFCHPCNFWLPPLERYP